MWRSSPRVPWVVNPLLTLHKPFPVEHSKTHSWKWRRRKPDPHWWWATGHQSPPQSILRNARNESEIFQHIYLVSEGPIPAPYGWELSGNIKTFIQLLFTTRYPTTEIAVDFWQMYMATGNTSNTLGLGLGWEVQGWAFFSHSFRFPSSVLPRIALPCLNAHRITGGSQVGVELFPIDNLELDHEILSTQTYSRWHV